MGMSGVIAFDIYSGQIYNKAETLCNLVWSSILRFPYVCVHITWPDCLYFLQGVVNIGFPDAGSVLFVEYFDLQSAAKVVQSSNIKLSKTSKPLKVD